MHTLQEINALMKTTGDQLFAVLCLGGRERQRERERLPRQLSSHQPKMFVWKVNSVHLRRVQPFYLGFFVFSNGVWSSQLGLLNSVLLFSKVLYWHDNYNIKYSLVKERKIHKHKDQHIYLNQFSSFHLFQYDS